MKKEIYVLKLGSNILLGGGGIDQEVLHHISNTIFNLKKKGIDTVVISSGAVALGRNYFGTDFISGLTETETLQVFASVGQPLLMEEYKKYLSEYNIKISQLLLTRRDFSIMENYNSIKKVIFGLLALGIIPIINENDVITPEELDFSDNDQLAVLVSGMLGANKMIVLSNVHGLYNKHPDDGGVLLKYVNTINENIMSMVSNKQSTYGKGGMLSKVKTAKIAMDLGIDMYIVNGKLPGLVEKIVLGKNPGTIFKAKLKPKIDSIRKWLKAGAVPVGKIQVSTIIGDLLKDKKRISILSIGIVKIINNFSEKDVIEVINEKGECLGLGIAKINSSEFSEAKDSLESKIVIHTDYFIYLSDFDKSF